MKLRQLRNATILLSLGAHRLLIDPMLSDPGAMPGFKVFGGGRRRNPLVPLPAGTDDALASVTGVVVTHEHPDHLDGPGLRWIKERALPVWTNGVDAPNLAKKGLDVHELRDGALGMAVETVASRHGRGAVGWLMGPVSGYYLAHPDEPSVYLTGDSVLTESVLDAIERLQPDVIVAPAGAANMGLGGDILFSVDELLQLARRARGTLVFNHLEALDHCPTTRQGLRARVAEAGHGERVHVPDDGEELSFARQRSAPHAQPRGGPGARAGVQKWLTAPFAGT
jgi:L-ascorbate metabolism protein UlaG (beta-lactamase superfamily)